MAKEKTSGLGVYNEYGPVKTNNGRVAELDNDGARRELQVDFRGESYGVVEGKLPKGATNIEVIVNVDEAFNLGGTSPTINIGTSGSAATNGASLSEAQAEAVGVYTLSVSGTWASALTADTDLAVELGGTSPTIGDEGHARVVIRYDLIK